MIRAERAGTVFLVDAQLQMKVRVQAAQPDEAMIADSDLKYRRGVGFVPRLPHDPGCRKRKSEIGRRNQRVVLSLIEGQHEPLVFPRRPQQGAEMRIVGFTLRLYRRRNRAVD